MTKIDLYVQVIDLALQGLGKGRTLYYRAPADPNGYAIYPTTEKMIRGFLEAVNPKYPAEVVNFSEMLRVVLGRGVLPSKKEIDALAELNRQVISVRGFWEYEHPALEQRYPFRDGSSAYWSIKYTPVDGDWSCTFPLRVDLGFFGDLDTAATHAPGCLRVKRLAYDCGCEAPVEHKAAHVFGYEYQFKEQYVEWVRGQFEIHQGATRGTPS